MAQSQVVRGVATSVRTHQVNIISVRYHKTDVVTFDPYTITLRSGGWKTATTKLRMNQASNQFDLGFGVFQKNHEWYVTYQGKTLDFSDGMVLNREG